MALPDYGRWTPGTPIIWGEAGAAGVTKTMSLDALASGSARMGASADLGATFPTHALIEILNESGTAPTAGGANDGLLAFSSDNTNWPAGVTGSDGAWPADGNEDEWKLQLGNPVAAVIATNDGTTVQIQNGVIVPIRARYVSPVLDVNWDQALRDEVTATNNDSRFKLTPLTWTQEDT